MPRRSCRASSARSMTCGPILTARIGSSPDRRVLGVRLPCASAAAPRAGASADRDVLADLVQPAVERLDLVADLVQLLADRPSGSGTVPGGAAGGGEPVLDRGLELGEPSI